MKTRPFLSGHCTPGNPPGIHDRCRGGHGTPGGFRPCSCPHHDETKAAPVTDHPVDEEPLAEWELELLRSGPKSAPTFRELPDLDQGSDAWHDQRRGMVTASVVGQLVTASTLKVAQNDTSRSLTALLVAERITGYTEPTYMSDDMYRGIVDEPIALDTYAEHYDVAIRRSGFMVRDEWGFEIGYSPDAVVVGLDGLVEVKSRRQKIQLQTILADAVPPANMAQLQCGLLVSGREWIDYVSYCAGMPMWTKRVTPDKRWHAAIVAAVEVFEETAGQMVRDYRDRTDGLPATERADNSLGLVF